MKNPFSPQSLIISAIREKCRKEGIEKIVLVFGISTDVGTVEQKLNEKYSVLLLSNEGKKLTFAIEEEEINMIKSLFVSKILKKYYEDNSEKVSAINISIVPDKDEINIYFELLKDKSLIKFNF